MAQHGSGVVVMEPALVKFLLRKTFVKREEKHNFQSILAGVAPILGAGGMVQTGFAGFWMVPKWCLNVPLGCARMGRSESDRGNGATHTPWAKVR